MKKNYPKIKIRTILLIRTDRIGDVILTTPAITLLKQQYPEARIIFLTQNYTRPLLKQHLFIDEIMTYDPEKKHRGFRGNFRLAQELKRKNIDAAFLFFPTFRLAFTLRLAQIPIRVGSGYRWYSFLFNHRIYEHRKDSHKHELEYNISLLKNFIDRLPKPSEIAFHFNLTDAVKRKADQVLKAEKIVRPFIIIHPGNGGSAPNLPPVTYSRIIQYLLQKNRWDVVVAGSKAETRLVDKICADNQHPRLHIAAGKWDIETYLALIARCRLFISSSTGPLHMARAFNIPLLAFYCTALPYTPRRWGPYNQESKVITPPVATPLKCSSNRCPLGNCLNHVEWSQIQTALEREFTVDR